MYEALFCVMIWWLRWKKGVIRRNQGNASFLTSLFSPLRYEKMKSLSHTLLSPWTCLCHASPLLIPSNCGPKYIFPLLSWPLAGTSKRKLIQPSRFYCYILFSCFFFITYIFSSVSLQLPTDFYCFYLHLNELEIAVYFTSRM